MGKTQLEGSFFTGRSEATQRPTAKEDTDQEQSRVGGTSGDCLVQFLHKPGLASKPGKADNRPRYYQLGYPKQPCTWARHSLST